MSKLNGDKSRFQINRKRKMRLRERLHVAIAAVKKQTGETTVVASDPPRRVGKRVSAVAPTA
jgi:hypothetical protein